MRASVPTVSRAQPWRSVLDGDQTAASLMIARDVAGRLRTPEQVKAAAETSRRQTSFPKTTNWQPHGVAQGYAGLALLWSYFDDCFPGEDWDATGKRHLELALRSAEQCSTLHLGMYSGLGGIAFVAARLSREGTRYRRLLATIDAALIPKAVNLARQIRQHEDGLGVSEFDVISGLAGIGRYLLLRKNVAEAGAALELVLSSLIKITDEVNNVPRWRTPKGLLRSESWRDLYPHGNVNCGLAHGIPGPLALLSLARISGVNVVGLEAAIDHVASWLCRNRVDDVWGINWATAIPLTAEQTIPLMGQALAGTTRDDRPSGSPAACKPSRTAWCYGSPGVARSLWLAGTALDDRGYRELSLAAMEAVYRRPLQVRQIDSSTFCHGVAGLLQITLRFANDTGLPMFTKAARALQEQIIATFEPESAVGFRNLEPGGTRVDQPGLLEGSSGVALVLLAAATSVEPRWDALFLLS
jgi:class I lanthipeptide synthase